MIVALIPAYNEEARIAAVIIRASKHVDKAIVCDDGSSDATGAIAHRMGAVLVSHDRNRGKGEALRTLFLKARELNPDIVVTLDADGQHNPDEIPRVIRPIQDGAADLVVGSRYSEEGGDEEVPTYRRLGAAMITQLVRWSLASDVRDTESGFRAYSRRALWLVTPSETGFGVDAEILMKIQEAGLGVVEVPIRVAYRGLQTSTRNPLYHGLDVVGSILKFVSLRHPLVFYGVPGLVITAFGLLFAYQTFEIYSRTNAFPTNYGLVALGAFVVGTLMLFVGIILFTLISAIRDAR